MIQGRDALPLDLTRGAAAGYRAQPVVGDQHRGHLPRRGVPHHLKVVGRTRRIAPDHPQVQRRRRRRVIHHHRLGRRGRLVYVGRVADRDLDLMRAIGQLGRVIGDRAGHIELARHRVDERLGTQPAVGVGHGALHGVAIDPQDLAVDAAALVGRLKEGARHAPHIPRRIDQRPIRTRHEHRVDIVSQPDHRRSRLIEHRGGPVGRALRDRAVGTTLDLQRDLIT